MGLLERALLKMGDLANPLSRWRTTPLSRSERKVCHLSYAVERTSSLSGDVVECGVGAGNTLAWLATMLATDSRCIRGLDTFAGFPQPTTQDNPSFSPDGRWKVYQNFDIPFVEKNLRRAGVTEDRFKNMFLEPGDVAQVLANSSSPISLLHLDLDLYQSYSDALRLTWDRLQGGAMVLIDEYDSPADTVKWPGAKIALDEFVAEMSVEIIHYWSGFVHIIKPEH